MRRGFFSVTMPRPPYHRNCHLRQVHKAVPPVPESSKKNGFLSLHERAGNWKHQKRLELATVPAERHLSFLTVLSLITGKTITVLQLVLP